MNELNELTDEQKRALLIASRVALSYTGTGDTTKRISKDLWPRLGGDPNELKK